MPHPNPKVDPCFTKAKHWSAEMAALRTILLSCDFTEELKWSKPCYTFQGANVVVLQGFKAYCALLFFKGVLLKDPHGILEKTGANTRVGRQIRFTDVQQITKLKPVLKAYLQQAINIDKSGLKVEAPKASDLTLPAELQEQLKKNPKLKAAFASLTPGRQRAYAIHFSSAKQSTTRAARVANCTPMILKGKGLNDF